MYMRPLEAIFQREFIFANNSRSKHRVRVYADAVCTRVSAACIIANKSNHNDQHQRYHSVQSYIGCTPAESAVCARFDALKFYVQDLTAFLFSRANEWLRWSLNYQPQSHERFIIWSHNAIPRTGYSLIFPRFTRASKRRIESCTQFTIIDLNPSLSVHNFAFLV